MAKPHFKIYYNSTRKLFSVKDSKTGKVVARERNIFIGHGCQLKVSAKGNARVRRTHKKTPHAFIECGGYTNFSLFGVEPGARPFRYNPYLNETFVDYDGNAVLEFREVWLSIHGDKPTCYGL